MSFQLSAQAITAHTAITRMSVRGCSTLRRRGSATAPKCPTSRSRAMIRSLLSRREDHLLPDNLSAISFHASPLEREVVAIDGKTLRRSFDRKHERAPLHLVSAWASAQGLVLGQRCVADKSNEITAILALLDQLVLDGSIVTLDAMGCQRAIAERILARGGDYLLMLKANHPIAQVAVAAHFEKHCFGSGAAAQAACDAFEDSHGRLA